MTQSIDVFSDARHFLPGGKWSCAAADIVANFPACKFLLHQDDLATGDLVWTDRVGNTVTTDDDPAGFIKDALGVRRTGSVTIVGGMPVTGTKDFVLMINGTFQAASVAYSLGDVAGAGPGIEVTGNNGGYIVNGAAYLNSAVLSGPPAYSEAACMSLHADKAGEEARKWYANNDGTDIQASTKDAGSSSGLINTDWPALSNDIVISAGGTSGLVMMALFAFTTTPAASEIEIANKWNAANPGKCYPGWAGKS